MNRGLVVLALGLLACSGGSGRPMMPRIEEDTRQALCPRALEGASMLDGFRHEIARGCPLPAFVSSDPLCQRDGQCHRPCLTKLFMGEREMPVSYEYDDKGNMISKHGGRMKVTCSFRGTWVVQCTRDDGSTVKVKRSGGGFITSAYDDKHTWDFTYDGRGELETVARPGMYAGDPPMKWTLAYDDQKRLATETEVTSGVRVTYVYDERGRMISRDEEGGPSPYKETFRYDPSDHLIASSSTRGFETTYSYDKGRIIEYSASNPQNPGAMGARFVYECP